jgi:hypothetical protein
MGGLLFSFFFIYLDDLHGVITRGRLSQSTKSKGGWVQLPNTLHLLSPSSAHQVALYLNMLHVTKTKTNHTNNIHKISLSQPKQMRNAHLKPPSPSTTKSLLRPTNKKITRSRPHTTLLSPPPSPPPLEPHLTYPTPIQQVYTSSLIISNFQTKNLLAHLFPSQFPSLSLQNNK